MRLVLRGSLKVLRRGCSIGSIERAYGVLYNVGYYTSTALDD